MEMDRKHKEWKKITRVTQDIYEIDKWNNRHIVDGKMFHVKFPDGTERTLPIIIRRNAMLIETTPFVQVQERAYFAIQYAGLPEVWIRAVDLEIREV